ncbi:MAG: hypothetical protein ACOX54_06680 [Christensenellales bacterium]|jgi:hypothetical protein
MIERFLSYSLQHNRKIKAIWTEDDNIKHGNIVVTEIGDDYFCYTQARKKTSTRMEKACLLSLGYARGDSGETDREIKSD